MTRPSHLWLAASDGVERDPPSEVPSHARSGDRSGSKEPRLVSVSPESDAVPLPPGIEPISDPIAWSGDQPVGMEDLALHRVTRPRHPVEAAQSVGARIFDATIASVRVSLSVVDLGFAAVESHLIRKRRTARGSKEDRATKYILAATKTIGDAIAYAQEAVRFFEDPFR